MGSRKNKVSCGIDFGFDADIESAIEGGNGNGYDFVCLNMLNPSQKKSFLSAQSGNRIGDNTNSDFMLISQEWSSLVVGKISSQLFCGSESDLTTAQAADAVVQELNFASYLSLPAVMVAIQTENCSNIARTIYSHLLTSHHNMGIWVNVTMGQGSNNVMQQDKEATASNPKNTWATWNKFRSLCNHHNRIGLSLEIPADLPDELTQKQWLGEPIRSIVLPTSIFLTNKKGYPVLSRAHQMLVMQFFRLNCQVVIRGGIMENTGYRLYQQYIGHIYENCPPLDQYEAFSKGYEDYLQAPLQPLMDNLESATYETFEKDPVKYKKYEEAIYKCLLTKVSDENASAQTIVLMVLGAGRGPLVRAALLAAKNAKRKVKCYAVEKNTNAAVTLQLLKRTEWCNEDVTVVSCDMRKWEAPQLADIIVSELLGSFGDNELSPECLDGAERFLKPDAVSIPCSYTSFISPISSQKLYNEVTTAGLMDRDKPREAAFETPYVVRIHNCNELDEPQPVFTFSHPRKFTNEASQNNAADKIDQGHLRNVRQCELTFKIVGSSLLHGFAGYFYCTLFDDVFISIVPKTHSPGMFSWFPIFFPLLNPIHVKEFDNVKLNIWRQCSGGKVWYEWAVEEPTISGIHNPAGRSYTIGL